MGQIKVMISSRCDDEFDGKKLSRIRKIMKKCLERVKIFGKPIFKVWINEDEPSRSGEKDAIETCLKEARDADIFLCLYNGNAGWEGVCHKELEEAYNQSPGKVILFKITPYDSKSADSKAKQLNEAFEKYVDDLNLFRGPRIIKTTKALKEDIKKSLREIALKLMKVGAREVSKSARDRGPVLDWARLTFEARRDAMIKKVSEALKGNIVEGLVIKELKRERKQVQEPDLGLDIKPVPVQVLFVSKAIPSSFSVSAAREMVGQPFLKDHELSKHLNGVIGPVHIIACSQNITEAQAMRLLGFPDAIIVKSGFGLYVADRIQKIQICFITHCVDESTTGHQVEKFLEWLEKDSYEVNNFIFRAESRTKIVKLIDKEA